MPAAGEPSVAPGGAGEIVLPRGDRRRGAPGHGAVPGVLRRKDREREDAAAYGRAVGQFLGWCEARGLRLRDVSPLHVAAYIRTHPGRPLR